MVYVDTVEYEFLKVNMYVFFSNVLLSMEDCLISDKSDSSGKSDSGIPSEGEVGRENSI